MNSPLRHSPTVRTFESPGAFFDAIFPNQQHDAHVEKWRGAEWLRNKHAEYTLRDAAVREACERICARIAARRKSP